MKSFEQIVEQSKVAEKTLNEIVLNESDFQYLNESQRQEVQEILTKFGDKKISELDEGILGSIIGGLTGFIVGPAIGKVIANALGIEKGIIYDMLTSRLVSAALGASITKYIGGSSKS